MTLEILTSSLLPTRHGFFTRKGGASSGVFHGLNCGRGSTDQADAVALNRARVAAAMEVAPEALLGLYQIHSARVITATAPLSEAPKADAIVTREPRLALSVLTADCMPVLFCEPESRVIGAAHAGWKGAAEGILEATIEAMGALGAARGQIRAAIGPCISQSAYEVGQDFREHFLDEDSENARFFVNGAAGKYQFDLPGYGLSRLRAAGIAKAEWLRHCTYADAERFYSYRRKNHMGEADYGRLIATIRL